MFNRTTAWSSSHSSNGSCREDEEEESESDCVNDPQNCMQSDHDTMVDAPNNVVTSHLSSPPLSSPPLSSTNMYPIVPPSLNYLRRVPTEYDPIGEPTHMSFEELKQSEKLYTRPGSFVVGGSVSPMSLNIPPEETQRFVKLFPTYFFCTSPIWKVRLFILHTLDGSQHS